MEKRETPPMDEDDPASSAVEVTPEKIDLQKKPPGTPGKNSPGPDSQPQSKPPPGT